MKKYITEYKLVRWSSPDMMVEQMNQCGEDGWRVDTTRLGKDNGESGWTVYSKSYSVMPDMNDALLPLRELWTIINSTAVFQAKCTPSPDGYSNPVAEEITKQVKAYYEKHAREMQ